mgnify:CR=1 FL=1
MIKKWLTAFLLVFLVLITPLAVYFLESPHQVKAYQEKVVYQLPYPGILPDNPLYVFKALRDQIQAFFIRDYQKKAETYLLYSDKRVNMAMFLLEKGKINLAITTFSKGEKYFLKIPPLLKEAKRQGQQIPSDFIDKLKLANAKHKEIADNFLKKIPQGETAAVMEIIKINEKIKTDLEKL